MFRGSMFKALWRTQLAGRTAAVAVPNPLSIGRVEHRAAAMGAPFQTTAAIAQRAFHQCTGIQDTEATLSPQQAQKPAMLPGFESLPDKNMTDEERQVLEKVSYSNE